MRERLREPAAAVRRVARAAVAAALLAAGPALAEESAVVERAVLEYRQSLGLGLKLVGMEPTASPSPTYLAPRAAGWVDRAVDDHRKSLGISLEMNRDGEVKRRGRGSRRGRPRR